MQSRGIQRLAPLTGVVFVVLIVVAVIVGGETPDNDDPAATIRQFWIDNEDEQLWGSVIAAWASLFFVWFAGSLRSHLRRAEGGTGRVSALNFAGAIIGATGLLTAFSFSFAIAEDAERLSPDAIQALTILSNGFFLPIAGGFAIFFFAAGVVAVRAGVLPAWLGWFSIVLGIACVTPIGFFALLIGVLWILGVSILLYVREGAAAEPPGPTVPQT
jgi:hypothetical protein